MSGWIHKSGAQRIEWYDKKNQRVLPDRSHTHTKPKPKNKPKQFMRLLPRICRIWRKCPQGVTLELKIYIHWEGSQIKEENSINSWQKNWVSKEVVFSAKYY